eukprot:NODE_14736_length_1089_cov_9.161123.p1 GENE.NODE_14736_length_1089_cov_9.161123~~NODE_14736_length_1089_cov_9.161123.p1  ORF type:complete len:296 (-),score=57.63 NODE_14736_length_1089_cov_9.161123:20-907(-)
MTQSHGLAPHGESLAKASGLLHALLEVQPTARLTPTCLEAAIVVSINDNRSRHINSTCWPDKAFAKTVAHKLILMLADVRKLRLHAASAEACISKLMPDEASSLNALLGRLPASGEVLKRRRLTVKTSDVSVDSDGIPTALLPSQNLFEAALAAAAKPLPHGRGEMVQLMKRDVSAKAPTADAPGYERIKLQTNTSSSYILAYDSSLRKWPHLITLRGADRASKCKIIFEEMQKRHYSKLDLIQWRELYTVKNGKNKRPAASPPDNDSDDDGLACGHDAAAASHEQPTWWDDLIR